jgi:tRNA A-37 threonylcarbamoyl transferase component Bud32
MMKNEVKIYRKLESLQGTVVPTLRFSGFSGETFLIGTDYIEGKHLTGNEKLKIDVNHKLKQKLAQFKIEHGDLREKNILEDVSGNYWVFDFGKSKRID